MTNSDNPSRDLCINANPILWEQFCREYASRYCLSPLAIDWSEEACFYWLDYEFAEMEERLRLEEAESVYDYYEKFDKPVLL